MLFAFECVDRITMIPTLSEKYLIFSMVIIRIKCKFIRATEMCSSLLNILNIYMYLFSFFLHFLLFFHGDIIN